MESDYILKEDEQARRKFLKQLTYGLGGTALAATGLTLPGLSSCQAQSGDKLGIALVGLGNYATNQLAPALQETNLCYLSGIVTGTPSKEKTWQEKYDIPDKNVYNYENFDQIADNPDIDIIYVVLPNSMHAEYTIRAAEAGKHVICEKPMAISVKECEQMIEACDRAGVKLSIGYRLHFEPYNQEVMRLGQEKVYGDIKLIENTFGFKIGDPDQWRLDKSMAGGGAMMDIGIYCINAARYITGEEPTHVLAQEFKTDPEKFKEVDETILWDLEFPSGVAASLTTTYAARSERLFATAEEGWFKLKPAYTYGPIHGETSEGEMDFPQVNQQARQMDAFADCVKNNKKSTVSGEEGLKDMQVIEAIYRSIDSGNKVKI